jgi:hypothetical protein
MLEAIIAQRCVDLAGQPDRIRSQTRFHWWPAPRPGSAIGLARG